MPHLLNVWHQVRRRLSSAGPALVLFDYDGTLAPIASRPELAALPSETGKALKAVSGRAGFTVGIVSGRSLADVTERVGLPGLIYAGNHGLEIKGPGLDFIHPKAADLKPRMNVLAEALQRRLGGIEGVLVEGKGLSLSVHYRLTPEALRGQVQEQFAAGIAEGLRQGHVRESRGKELLEVRPNVAWDKGRAIARIAAALPQGCLIMYFGDDLTDEDGFAMVNQQDGISVFVGAARQPTVARYRVDCPKEVGETLHLLTRL